MINTQISKNGIFLFLIIFYLFFGNAEVYPHLCDNVFRQADKLIVKPENYNMVVKDKAAFKIFLQNNMDRGIAEISLIAESSAFNFEITPEKMQIPKGSRVYFEVTMQPRKGVKSGNYPIDFRLVGGGREFKSFSLNMDGGAGSQESMDTSRLLHIKPVDTLPAIDGALDDKCWSNASLLSNFSSEKGGKALFQTTALIAYDRDYIYFGIHCTDDDIGHLSFHDEIMIQFATGESPYPLYTIILPAEGYPVFKKVITKGDVKAYLPKELKYSVANDEGYWTVEIAMPFSELDVKAPVDKGIWQMRITREKATGVIEKSFWAQDTAGSNRQEGFGRLVIAP